MPIASTLHDLTDMAVAVKNIGPEEHIDEAVENPAPASFEFLTV
jgi:hypothetical protein